MNQPGEARDDGPPVVPIDRSTLLRRRDRLTVAPGFDDEPLYYRTDGPYTGNAPRFYDVDQFRWTERLRAQWRAIRDEYEANVRRGTDHVVDVFNPAGPKIAGWRSVNFQTYLWRFHRARRAFPVTVALLDAIPGLTSAFINVLAPGAAIPAHQGDSNAIVRFHLGLDVPSGDCGVRVGPETRQCRNGTLLAFCDAHEHASWNATTERRVVLVFDVMLPRHRRRCRWICANVLSATGVICLETRLSALRRTGRVRLPRVLRTALRRAGGLAIALWLPIQRRRSWLTRVARST
jgi:beta-hydroxylase